MADLENQASHHHREVGLALISPQLYNGPFSITLAPDLVGIIYDLPPGGMQRLRREKDGIEDVVAELSTNVPHVGAEAGISSDVYARFVKSTDDIGKIRAAKQLVAKLAEVLEESEGWHEHERETWISMMVDAIKSTARHSNANITAIFEKTLEYNGRAAVKAAKTRRKNAEAMAKEAESPEAEEAPGDDV